MIKTRDFRESQVLRILRNRVFRKKIRFLIIMELRFLHLEIKREYHLPAEPDPEARA